MASLHSPAWMNHAACRDSDIDVFFPISPEGVDEAVAVCRDCSVRRKCLTFALENPDLSGVWGGTSNRQRVRLRQGQSSSVLPNN
jgi:WhiB family transcriptional regulator, redox-sensing transcriptional regulator